MTRMGQRRAAILRSSIPDEAEIEDKTEDGESDELLDAVLAALENEDDQLAEEDWEDQRWLSEIIYHYMGRLAGRSRRGGESEFNVTESILTEGIGDRLGLHELEDVPLLRSLAREFYVWLNTRENKTYVAGWGKLVADDLETIRIEPFMRDVHKKAGEEIFTGEMKAKAAIRALRAEAQG